MKILILFLCLQMAVSESKPAGNGKTVITGRFIKSDSCRDFLKTLPPGAVLNMKDPCGIECNWFSVKDRDNVKSPEISPDEKGNFRLETELNGLSFFRVNSVYHGKLFFMYPCDTVRLSIIETDPDKPVIFEQGFDTAQALYFRNESRWNCYNGFARWKKPLNDSLLFLSQAYTDSCIRPYMELKNRNLCSPEFFDFVSTSIRYYVAYQVSQTLWSMYEFDTIGPVEKRSITRLLDKIYLRTPLCSGNYITPAETGFYDYILTWIWLQYLESGKETDKYKGDPAMLCEKLAMAKPQLTKGAYEIFALDLIDTHAQRMDTVALGAFRKFQQEFPRSDSDYGQCYQHTQKNINGLREFVKAATARENKEIRFIDGTSVNSLADLVKLFPGQQLYVDMWATWCMPCIMLFKYNAGIKPFLKEHGITEVFLSLDKDTVKWKTAVKYHNLEGVNIIASPALLKDLRRKLKWEGGVPRFFIISSDGKLTNGDAFQPIAKDQLFKQLLEQ